MVRPGDPMAPSIRNGFWARYSAVPWLGGCLQELHGNHHSACEGSCRLNRKVGAKPPGAAPTSQPGGSGGDIAVMSTVILTSFALWSIV